MASSNSSSHPDPSTMISAFRVAELKQFLKAINVSTGGRKKQLQERATKLVETGNPKIITSLTQIYDATFPSGGTSRTPLPKPPISHSTTNPPPLHVKHPDVKFKSHPFYQHIDCVYRTTAMESTSYMKKAMTIQFHLTPQHIRHIFDSETTPGNYRTQVILRFCKNETSCEQEDYYPGNCYITINNQSCPIPGYNPNYSMRPEIKRHGKPINITTYIHTSAAIVNTVMFTWSHDIMHTQGFCFSIDLMTCLSPLDLLQKLKGKATRSRDVSKAMIRDKLLVDKEAEISTTSLRISLVCPLSKSRIVHPCKSTSCDHLQCFDGSMYLQMNERKAKWVCPVCDRPAPFSDLLIDGYVCEILEKSSEDLIEFSSDGSWHSVNPNKDKTVSLTPPTSIMIVDSPQYMTNNILKKPHPLESSEGPSGVIDLTLESDDDDDATEQILDIIRSRSDSRSQSDSSDSESETESEDSDTATTNERPFGPRTTPNEFVRGPFHTVIQHEGTSEALPFLFPPVFNPQRMRSSSETDSTATTTIAMSLLISSCQSSTRVPVISYSSSSNNSSSSTLSIPHASLSLSTSSGPIRSAFSAKDMVTLGGSGMGSHRRLMDNASEDEDGDAWSEYYHKHQRRRRKRHPQHIADMPPSRVRYNNTSERLCVPSVPYISGCSPISSSSADSS